MNNVEKMKDIFKGPVVLFLAVAFIPAWILFLTPVFLRMAGIEDTTTAALAAWSAAMWMPGLGATIATRRVEKKELKTLGLGKLGKKKIYLCAWLGPILAVLITGGISWLYLKTKSPWAPALAHGTVNAVAGLPLLFLTDVNLSLGGSLTSVSGWLALAALVGILCWKREIPLK